MNILFLGKRSDNNVASGVEKKMTGQISGFRQLGHQVWYLCTEKDKICLIDNNQNKQTVLQYSESRISIYWAYEKAVEKVVEKYPDLFEMCYIRKILCTSMHLHALSKLKKAGIYIIEEIPTYPYDNELENAKDIMSKIYLMVDKLFRIKFKKYVNRFVTFSDDEMIFGVKTIQISNGVDVKKNKLRKVPKEDLPLRILAVSQMQFWHGYDRLIRGLAEYYAGNNLCETVILELVGNGPMYKEWKQLAMDLGIQKYVNFYGELSGENLDEIFNKSHIAVSSLANYRKNITKSSDLKTREYAARGIPFVISCEDIGIAQLPIFCTKVPFDNTNINIESLKKFYTNIPYKGNELRNKVREYAEQEFTWERQLEKVIRDSVKKG